MSRESRQQMPRFLLQETRVETEWDGSECTSNHWYPYAEMHEVEAHITVSDRPGYGTDLRRIAFQVYDMTLKFRSAHEVPPQTMADLALSLVEYPHSGCTRLGVKVKVDVELTSTRRTPTVFWNSEHNSFVIVRPSGDPGRANAEKRLTWDQGVMLLAVNGIGEIRFDVDPRDAGSPECAEAVAYFNLTCERTDRAIN